MNVILTEDSRSGKEFLEMLSDYCYKYKNIMSEVYDTGYGDRNLQGNNTKFKQAFEALLSDGKIKRGDTLIICYDSIVIDENSKRHSRTVQYLASSLKAIRKLCNKYKVNYKESDYTCFEELILSYNNLLDVTNYRLNDNFDPAFQNNMNRLCKELNRCKSKADRAAFYYKHYSQISKIENDLSRQLEIATGSSNKYFKNWFICKSSIGICWKEIDCRKNKCIKDKEKCQSCIVAREFKTASKLWSDLIHNSTIQYLYELIIN